MARLVTAHGTASSEKQTSQAVSYRADSQINGFIFAKLGTDGQVTIHNAGSAAVTVSVDIYSCTQPVPEVEPTDAVMPESGGTYLTSVRRSSASSSATAAVSTSTGTTAPTATTGPPKSPNLVWLVEQWCGASGRTKCMNIGFNAKVRYLRYVARPYWLRIEAWPSGKVSLRGGT